MNPALDPYIFIVDFLADFLGENAEVVLHDFGDLEHSVVKIRHGHVSGRQVGDPSTDFVMRVLKREISPDTQYVCNYEGISIHKTRLKCSSFYIRDGKGKIVGMLCINLEIEQYIKAKEYLDSILLNLGPGSTVREEKITENFGQSISELIESGIQRAVSCYDCAVDRLTYAEKEQIIERINNEGIFLLKGAVSKVAQALNISEPTVYRYLSKLKNA